MPAEVIAALVTAVDTLTRYVPLPPTPVVPLTPSGPRIVVATATPVPARYIPTNTVPVRPVTDSTPTALMTPVNETEPAEIYPMKVVPGVPTGQYVAIVPSAMHAFCVAETEPTVQYEPVLHVVQAVAAAVENDPGGQFVHMPRTPGY